MQPSCSDASDSVLRRGLRVLRGSGLAGALRNAAGDGIEPLESATLRSLPARGSCRAARHRDRNRARSRPPPSSGCTGWATTATAGRRWCRRSACRRALAIRFLFPHAPTMPVSINNGYVMRAWYDIREANLNERADLDGVRRSQAAVEAMIAHEKARGIADVAHRARRLLAGRRGRAVRGPAPPRAARRHRRAVDVPDRRARARGRGRAREPRRADLHGARHATIRSCASRGPSSRGRRSSPPAGTSNGTPTRWSTRRCSRKWSPSARSCSACFRTDVGVGRAGRCRSLVLAARVRP